MSINTIDSSHAALFTLQHANKPECNSHIHSASEFFYNTFILTAASNKIFLHVGFVLQSAFKPAFQISVVRQQRGGREGEVTKLKPEGNVLDVAACLVRKITRVFVASGYSP